MQLDLEVRKAIGRMLVVGVRGSTKGMRALHLDLNACVDARVGGVILFEMDASSGEERNIVTPTQTQMLTTILRDRLGGDLLVCVDQEGGRVARLSARNGFVDRPTAVEFARLPGNDQYCAAREMADELVHAGFNVNFAPCVDVNVNPENPVIGARDRAYSADPKEVVRSAENFIRAHHDAGIITCLKHFPGHGSATQDSHDGFVDITDTHEFERELTPYSCLMNARVDWPGVGMVMIGHLYTARIDPEFPASLSHKTITKLLREQMEYDGVVIVDSLDMCAITEQYAPDDALVLAINAGADILMHCNNIQSPTGATGPCPAFEMREAIEKACVDGRIAGGSDRLLASAERIRRLQARCRPAVAN